MRVVELFAGIGGFRYGLESVGRLQQKMAEGRKRKGDKDKRRDSQLRQFRCVWANEIDKYACQVYRKNFGDKELHEGDIRTVKPECIPAHELLTAGFPCQSFSIAGKRKGFEDTRGTLFYEIARIARAKRSKLLLLENVRGLLSHDSGQTFGTILATLSDMGYVCEWQICNSKNYGVPQNRERVFIVGHLGEICGQTVFPDGENNKSDGKTSEERQKRKTWISTLDSRYGQRWSSETYVREAKRVPLKYLNRNQRHYEGDYAFTVDAANTAGIKMGTKIRRLTPTECERLQGFPDGWTEKGINKDGKEVAISDTQRYHCLGNAVTTTVIKAIGERIKETR